MPGIVGLVTSKRPEEAKDELARMVRAISHEPFYEVGMWSDETLGAYAGWATHRHSFASGMPLQNEQQDVALIFSGEEYPDSADVARLRQKGHAFEAGNASYLVHCYEDEASFPANLNGLFHGLVVDRRTGTAALFIDRFGMHRLYYYEVKDTFYFAAEAKAILAVRPELRRPDLRGVGEFLACGCVLENRTLFDGIRVLPGGSRWEFRDRRLEHRAQYFRPAEWEAQAPLDEESYYEAMRDAVAQALPRYFNGDDRIGVALTGGLDTRLIMAWQKPKPRSLSCYTFGSTVRDTQDVVVARHIAAQCQQSYQVIPAGPEFLSRFSRYAERSVYLTDACLEVSRSTDLFFSEQARRIAPIKVVGTYGSEVLTVVPTFKPDSLQTGLFTPDFLQPVRTAEATYANVRLDHPVTFAAFRQSPWWHYGVLALEQTQLSVRSPYLDNNFIRTIYRAPTGTARDVRLRLISDRNPRLAAIPTDRGVGGSRLLRAYQEFTLRAEYAYDSEMPQWLAVADHSLERLRLERLFLGRHKPAHFRTWYRDALSGYLREVLLDRRTLTRPYLNKIAVETVVQSHVNGTRNYTRDIHKLLTLELMQRLFFD